MLGKLRKRWRKLPAEFRRWAEVGALGVAFLAVLLFMAFGSPSYPGAPRRLVTIKAGTSLFEVSQTLEAHHLVRNAAAFGFLARAFGGGQDLVPGIYALSPGHGALAILRALQTGDGRQLKVTVPEGFSASRIARLLDEEGLATGSVFLGLVSQPRRFVAQFPWLATLPAGSTLEGLLFPDTYLFEAAPISEQALIDKMLAQCQAVLRAAYDRESAHTLGFYPTLTLASIIELEAAVPEERPLIAGVFTNRLRQNMPLGSDPTVEYALGWHQGRKGLSFRDIRVDSPYNTYRYPGLPPGPIGNPGLASFKAAMHPEATDMLYFVARGHGTHAFSRTYAEHLQAQRRYRS